MDVSRRYVVHLPFVAPDLLAAARLARVLARWFAIMPQADPGETTVSEENAQGVRHRVFCDVRMPSGRRCVLRVDHDGHCACRLRR